MNGCFYKKWLLMERCMVALQDKKPIEGNMDDCFNKTELRIIDRNMHVCFYKNWLLMGRWIVAFTKNDYWWKYACLLYITEGILMEWCMVALQDRRTIDGKMNGCFYKKWLLMERYMVALQDRKPIDGNMHDCFNKTEELLIGICTVGFTKKWLLMERCMFAFTKNDHWWKDVWLLYKTEGLLMEIYMVAFIKKDHWWKDEWLLYKTEGILMEWCMVALQNRRTIDGKMHGCFTKQKDY